MALTPSTMLPLGTEAPNFSLLNVVDGTTASVTDFDAAPALLVMFICNHCPTTFEENPVDDLPPPPANKAVGLGERPVFTPYTIAPSVRDPDRAARIVESHYPSMLREAGIGGTVVLWAFIDTNGIVKNTEVNRSSGYKTLDEAAQQAVMKFRFNPAVNRDEKVPVWVALPITFRMRF